MITHHATQSSTHDPQAINYRAVRARLMREYTHLLRLCDPLHTSAALARQIAAKERELAQNALEWAEAEDAQDQTDD